MRSFYCLVARKRSCEEEDDGKVEDEESAYKNGSVNASFEDFYTF